MDETLRLFHSGWHDRLCLTLAGRRVQRSVNHVWKPVVSSLWAIPGPPLPDTWHRAAPEVLHAPASVSLRRLRVARVVQSRRFRAAALAPHAPAGPLIIRAVRLRSRAVRPATARLRRTAPDMGRTRRQEPETHGRGFSAHVRPRPTSQPSSGGPIAVAASATRRRRTEQPDQQHDKREKYHRSKQAPVTAVAAWHDQRRRADWCLWRQRGLAERAGLCARDDDLRAGGAAHVTVHRIRCTGTGARNSWATLGSVAQQAPVL